MMDSHGHGNIKEQQSNRREILYIESVHCDCYNRPHLSYMPKASSSAIKRDGQNDLT